ncbi:GTPase HflX [Telmatobacter sp. DSM 110680]|uniref:GTPase HflX n=1 Tax=Telmatobacter sp. DSM 110680 TaxID=3036704 RepID=A0AAU7DIR5_9BACT
MAVEGGARGRVSSTTDTGRWRDRPERAVLVGVDFTARPRATRAGLEGARRAALRSNDDEVGESESGELQDRAKPAADSPGLDADESLAEFRELIRSAGGEIAAELMQRRSRPDPATLIGAGKVEEIAGVAASTNADLVLFDHDLSPTQLRNLEAALPCRVLDRTQLILDIFARHARTREGQLQVELAQLEYMLPRLTGRGKAMSQLGGGIGTRGPGETQLETDRRKIQRRIDQVKLDLDAVKRVRRQQRQRRESAPVPTVALVGYTNAGKSTLFNQLTGAHVLQSARMFATLDPKLRAIELPSKRRILLSDTVGFIRNLPHTLVTSFRATLEEVEQAEILLHVRDASSTYGEEQKAQVEKVLDELEALGKPRIEVLNKIDLLDADEREGLAAREQPRDQRQVEVLVSAQTGEGMDALLAAIDRALFSDPVIETELRVPQSDGAALAAIESGMVIHSRAYEGNIVRLVISGPASLVGRLRKYRLHDDNPSDDTQHGTDTQVARG